VSYLNLDQDIWNQTSFPNKVTPDEDIILVAREDILVLLFNFIGFFGAFVILLFIRIFLVGSDSSLYLGIYDTIMYGLNVMFLTIFMLQFHNYYLSLQILTNKRLIDIDQNGIFKREVNEIAIEKIENVNYKQSFLGVIFNFGNVIVDTAGAATLNNERTHEDAINGFVFNNVPEPREVMQTVTEVYQREKEAQKHEQARLNAEYMEQMYTRRVESSTNPKSVTME
jgi:uncharacterized membrane protein YdbT with pleckstrin-like domain